MIFPEWPAFLPQAPLLSAYQEVFSSTAVAVTTGNKSLLVRRNSTRAQNKINVAFNLNREQADILETFYYNTIQGGSDIFTFTHPRTHKTIICSFDPTVEQGYTLTPQDSMSNFKVEATFVIWGEE